MGQAQCFNPAIGLSALPTFLFSFLLCSAFFCFFYHVSIPQSDFPLFQLGRSGGLCQWRRVSIPQSGFPLFQPVLFSLPAIPICVSIPQSGFPLFQRTDLGILSVLLNSFNPAIGLSALPTYGHWWLS